MRHEKKENVVEPYEVLRVVKDRRSKRDLRVRRFPGSRERSPFRRDPPGLFQQSLGPSGARTEAAGALEIRQEAIEGGSRDAPDSPQLKPSLRREQERGGAGTCWRCSVLVLAVLLLAGLGQPGFQRIPWRNRVAHRG